MRRWTGIGAIPSGYGGAAAENIARITKTCTESARPARGGSDARLGIDGSGCAGRMQFHAREEGRGASSAAGERQYLATNTVESYQREGGSEPFTREGRAAWGTIGEYYANGSKYQLFIIETDSAQDAAILLLDLKATLKDPAYIAYMGGYFGTDAGGGVYVFAKAKYLAGVVGLDEATADPIARQLAARLY